LARLAVKRGKGDAFGDPVAAALHVVGGRWTLAICGTLAHGRLSFSQLRRALPRISANLLTLRLARLVADGVVERLDETGDGGPGYRLTAWGSALTRAIDALARWSSEHHGPPRP
jgi:DNA-binding HxlR family transcriptional regulator